MKVKLKKLHPDAVIPKYAKDGDAGLDLVTVDITESNNRFIEYDTGLAVEIPKGYVGLLFPRSSISKTRLSLANSIGVIDSSFRGSIKLRFRHGGFQDYTIGDRVGQLIIMPYPQIEFEEVEELSDTERGSGGFGSSGN